MSKIKELVAAGHALAKDLHCAESAALVRELATQLEVQFVRSTNMAVQLANAESTCRELAAENATLKHSLEGTPEFCYAELPKTPATDAFLAEVRASAIPDEATERDLFEEWVMGKTCVSKTTLEGLRTDDGYRNSTLSGTDYNGMWSQWKAIRAAKLRQEAAQ